ncbi:MAG: ABC transporter ATP-binding protein [Lachnospiraceae bacterium]|nr:ABC transporter ATP-binding protein [Lachnospiraceae bacterium]
MAAPGPKTPASKKYERARDPKKALRGLWNYLKLYKWLLFSAVLLTFAGNGLALVGPMLSGKAIDAIVGIGQVDFDTVFYYAGWMVIFYAASSALSYGLALLMRTITQKTVRKMRQDVFNKLMELPVGYFDTHMSGDIISRISYDIDVINTSLSNDVVQICASVVTVTGSFIMMVIIAPSLVVVMLVTIPMSILYTRYMTKRTRPRYAKRSAKLGEMNGFVEEMITGQKVIQAYAREEVMEQRFYDVNKAAMDAYYDADYMNATMGPTVNFINNLSLTLVTVFGALLYLKGTLSIGNISSFVQYSRKFSGPINEVANIAGEIQSALAAAERVFRVLNEEEEVADVYGAVDLDRVEGRVEIKDVSFGYDENTPILKDFSLDVEPGKLIAVVGPTGAGKTTLINLLMRFYDPQKGEIRIDGKENREIKRDDLRRAYAMVLQDTWVFGGTIFENIAYGREDATMEEVVEAAKAAHIHSYIRRLPDGYNTILTEDGVNISKGQKQLLTIARAMLLDSKMLILDEATSNVDTRTEIRIQQAMEKLMEGKTCFIIAHRLSTIQHADVILVVDNGQIVERGNHEELIAKKGFYYGLYTSQYE